VVSWTAVRPASTTVTGPETAQPRRTRSVPKRLWRSLA